MRFQSRECGGLDLFNNRTITPVFVFFFSLRAIFCASRTDFQVAKCYFVLMRRFNQHHQAGFRCSFRYSARRNKGIYDQIAFIDNSITLNTERITELTEGLSKVGPKKKWYTYLYDHLCICWTASGGTSGREMETIRNTSGIVFIANHLTKYPAACRFCDSAASLGAESRIALPGAELDRARSDYPFSWRHWLGAAPNHRFAALVKLPTAANPSRKAISEIGRPVLRRRSVAASLRTRS